MEEEEEPAEEKETGRVGKKGETKEKDKRGRGRRVENQEGKVRDQKEDEGGREGRSIMWGRKRRRRGGR